MVEDVNLVKEKWWVGLAMVLETRDKGRKHGSYASRDKIPSSTHARLLLMESTFKFCEDKGVDDKISEWE